jgi:hypothetical protein
MTGDPHMFASLDEGEQDQDKITFGDNSKGKVKGLGKVAISNDHSLLNVLYVAILSFNLLSIGQLCDMGFQCLFDEKEVVVTKKEDSKMIFKGFRFSGFLLRRCKFECMFAHQDFSWVVMA